jgi:hypothetical protein
MEAVSASSKENNLPHRKLHQVTQIWCKRPLFRALKGLSPMMPKAVKMTHFWNFHIRFSIFLYFITWSVSWSINTTHLFSMTNIKSCPPEEMATIMHLHSAKQCLSFLEPSSPGCNPGVKANRVFIDGLILFVFQPRIGFTPPPPLPGYRSTSSEMGKCLDRASCSHEFFGGSRCDFSGFILQR